MIGNIIQTRQCVNFSWLDLSGFTVADIRKCKAGD